MQKWEYKEETFIEGRSGGWTTALNEPMEKYLNKMGTQGWEVVSLAISSNVMGGMGYGGGSITTRVQKVVILKRPLT